MRLDFVSLFVQVVQVSVNLQAHCIKCRPLQSRHASDGVLPDVVKGAYKLHALEVRAVELGHHGLHLRPLQHTHEYSLYNVVIVVAQCYLVAAQLLCVAVEIPPAHSGAEVAGGLFNMVNRLEYV